MLFLRILIKVNEQLLYDKAILDLLRRVHGGNVETRAHEQRLNTVSWGGGF